MTGENIVLYLHSEDTEFVDGIERFLDWDVKEGKGSGKTIGFTRRELSKLSRLPKKELKDKLLSEFGLIFTGKDIGLPKRGYQNVDDDVIETIANFPDENLFQKDKDFIIDLLLRLGFKEDYVIPWMEKNIDSIALRPNNFIIRKGYTGLGVLINNEWAIKFDKMPRIGIEHQIYTSSDFGAFSDFTPSVKYEGFDLTGDKKYGALILENVAAKKPGYIKAVESYSTIPNNEIDYNLFLMGLFHKCASDNRKLKNLLDTVIYEDINSIAHHLSANMPLKDTTGQAYKRFMETSIPTNEIVGAIETYNSQLKAEKDAGSLAIIHGDWKPENMVNGYLVDFAMVGFAHEVDELAYYFSDVRFNFKLENFHKAIDNYIELRNSHNREFQIRMLNKGKEEMHQIADSSFLRQLVLRHSVMKKRDMNDDTKYKERAYYQQRIKQVLSEGRFI